MEHERPALLFQFAYERLLSGVAVVLAEKTTDMAVR
jgi:hypothetical protein